MKFFFYGIILSCLLLSSYSCSKKGEAITEYSNCMNSILNDSLITTPDISVLKKQCFDSIIIEKYELEENAEFIGSFDSIEEVKNIVISRNAIITKNIDQILQKYNFKTEPKLYRDWSGSYRTYAFDGKMFTQILYEIPYGGRYSETQRWTGTYKIEIEQNGKAYITINFGDRDNDIYQLMKSSKNGYYLKGRRTLWQEEKQ